MTTTTPTAASAVLIAEVKREATATRRLLERVPADKLTWSPHPRSMSLGTLALHVAAVPGALADFLSEPVREVPDFTAPEAASLDEVLTTFDRSVASATRRLASWRDDDLLAEWRLKRGDDTLLAMPRRDMVRTLMLNHWYHHRGQLTVYLRLLGLPLPSIYGPTADENPMGP